MDHVVGDDGALADERLQRDLELVVVQEPAAVRVVPAIDK
jgi:tetraacyldisaccharide-1-P 4'-kinase